MMHGHHGGPVQRRLARIGRFCVARPRTVLGAWLVVAVALVGLAGALGRPTDNDVTLPGSDAQAARDLMPSGSGGDQVNGQLVVHVDSGRLDDPDRRAALAEAERRIAEVEHVTRVTGPTAAQGSLSADGRTGYLTIGLDLRPRDVDRPLAERIEVAAQPARAAGITTVDGGVLAAAGERGGARTSELIGLAVAALVLLFAFGGLVAAAMPLLTAIFTLACAVSAIGLAGHLTGIPSVATTLATMIGLGVGIDYALFLITRHRGLLAGGLPVADAVVRSVAGSGSAVVFAGGTVVIALGGLAVAGVPILGTLGWTAGLVVVFAVAGAVTLLPALLALLGRRVDALRLRPARILADGDRAAGTPDGAGWARLADRVTRRPVRWLLLSTVLLGVLATPVLDLRLGQTDAGHNPPGSASRTSYELLAGGFGPGINGPLTVVVRLDPPAAGPADPRLADLTRTVAGTPGVAGTGPVNLGDDRTVATLSVRPTTAPGDPATAELVHGLRRVAVAGQSVHVGGVIATRVDLADRIRDRMPLVIGVVVLLSALLLLAAFRAPVLAAKAALMNLVSVGAAYGALTAVFGWGWGVELTGLTGPVPIESYVPMMLFALLFGLSMDYEVFLLTAVQEAWRATGDNRVAVRAGLAGTGRVITSAALIMITVFASFVLHADPVIKMFGLGMAVAIAVDATLVRGLLVPSTMALLGRANWWQPRRRRRPAPSVSDGPDPVSTVSDGPDPAPSVPDGPDAVSTVSDGPDPVPADAGTGPGTPR
ncbi:MMPL family transporter [Micromonospora echinofusca]|uniref:MMPL family transporter n=1 Tax=Micromonospora echinofusca TaxID=47858 RepID=A0ABS3VVT1_MICEH|nr:MMPL family transporter [Micromonospora echinofusca]MBO4208605.1 MMPL family transporter [Micromonospora echinofusca]